MIDPTERPNQNVAGTGRSWAQIVETLQLLGRERDFIVLGIKGLLAYLREQPGDVRDPGVIHRHAELTAQYHAVDQRINAAVRAYEALRMGYGPIAGDLAALLDDLDAHRGPDGRSYGYVPGATDPAPLRSAIARRDFPTVEPDAVPVGVGSAQGDAAVVREEPEAREAQERSEYVFGRGLHPLISRKRAEFARSLVAYGRIRGEELRDDELTREQLRERRRLEFGRWLLEHGRIRAEDGPQSDDNGG
jgi:hypothetical protein